MPAHIQNLDGNNAPGDPFRTRRWFGVFFAFFLPAFITWVYFVLMRKYPIAVQQTVYLTVKVVQFAFPAVWTMLALREPLRTGRPTAVGLLMGVAFGIVVVGAGMAVFHFGLRGTAVFAKAAELIHQKITDFGVDTAGKYFLLAGFYSLFHSLFEEYYWRWFVFHQLRKLVPVWSAIVLSAIGFTLHHVVVLSIFFRSEPWLVVLFASAVAFGGVFWAWLYNRSSSIFDTWFSHLLLDAGLFFGIGYQLVGHLFAAAK